MNIGGYLTPYLDSKKNRGKLGPLRNALALMYCSVDVKLPLRTI